MPRWNYLDDNDRFYSKVNKNGKLVPNMTSPCWEWIGYIQKDGYGIFNIHNVDGWKSSLAHRVAWEIFFGKIPTNLYVCHHCDNPSCVNPNHLFLGSQTDNMRDMVRKNRINDRRGELNPKSKLTNLDILKIRQLCGNGKTFVEVSKIYGVSDVTIGNIAKRETWKHIESPLEEKYSCEEMK